MENKIVPLLLGGDLNCYSVARSFFEEYGVTSYIIGRYKLGVTQNSKFIKFIVNEDIDKPEKFEEILHSFASEHKNEGTLVLMGCTDDYVALISHHMDNLNEYVINTPKPEIIDYITNKANFYTYCDKVNLDHPGTVIYSKGEELKIPFEYPIIIKPAVSALYWKFPFEGMEKVYTANSYEHAKEIIDTIYASGFPEKIIIQDRIPGDDSFMYTMSTYSDKDGKVRYMCLGHIFLEEHTPKGTGSDCAIITVENDGLCEDIKRFLESLNYTGYTNWDIKYDSRDGKFKAFEVNCRQGRSNYHVTCCGQNIGKMIVDDQILHKPFTTCEINRNKIYWRVVPDKVVNKYVSDNVKQEIKELKKAKKAYNTLICKYDMTCNIKRSIFVFENQRRYIKKYKLYYHPETM